MIKKSIIVQGVSILKLFLAVAMSVPLQRKILSVDKQKCY